MRSLIVLLLLARTAAADTLAERLEQSELVNVSTLAPAIQVDLAYSHEDNFLDADVYGDLDACYLNRDAAAMLAKASELLAERHPELRLHVFDCVRPLSVQKKMWAIVKDTPQRAYVASPRKKVKSLHNYGCAVDLTISDTSGIDRDMGTPFDHFGPEAEPRRELELLEKGSLTRAQLSNRLLLRRVMVDAGFLPLANEWWHFNCATGKRARKSYQLIK